MNFSVLFSSISTFSPYEKSSYAGTPLSLIIINNCILQFYNNQKRILNFAYPYGIILFRYAKYQIKHKGYDFVNEYCEKCGEYVGNKTYCSNCGEKNYITDDYNQQEEPDYNLKQTNSINFDAMCNLFEGTSSPQNPKPFPIHNFKPVSKQSFEPSQNLNTSQSDNDITEDSPQNNEKIIKIFLAIAIPVLFIIVIFCTCCLFFF